MDERLRAVLFDVDGTLVDSVDLHARAWQEAFAHFGKRVSLEDVRAQMGDQLIPAFLTEEELRTEGEALDRYRGEVYRRDYLPRVRPFPGARELVVRVRATGRRVALASSAKEPEIRYLEKLLGLDRLLDAETTSDDAERSKPHPDIFQAALARVRAPPSEAIVVGDSPWDVLAARRASVRAIGVLSGGFPEDELREAGAIAIYREPADLLARFERSPLA